MQRVLDANKRRGRAAGADTNTSSVLSMQDPADYIRLETGASVLQSARYRDRYVSHLSAVDVTRLNNPLTTEQARTHTHAHSDTFRHTTHYILLMSGESELESELENQVQVCRDVIIIIIITTTMCKIEQTCNVTILSLGTNSRSGVRRAYVSVNINTTVQEIYRKIN